MIGGHNATELCGGVAVPNLQMSRLLKSAAYKEQRHQGKRGEGGEIVERTDATERFSQEGNMQEGGGGRRICVGWGGEDKRGCRGRVRGVGKERGSLGKRKVYAFRHHKGA